MMISLERTGTSLHFWLGPLGVHVWRHRGTHQTSLIDLDWQPKLLGLDRVMAYQVRAGDRVRFGWRWRAVHRTETEWPHSAIFTADNGRQRIIPAQHELLVKRRARARVHDG